MMTALTRARAGIAVAPPPVVTRTSMGAVTHTGTGTGDAVLTLHGAMGGADQSWLLGQALFAEPDARRVIGVARPGYPGTPLALGASPEEQADLYAALLDAMGIDRAVVAAVSAGGPSALQFALRHPGRCAGLILVSAATGRLDASLALPRLRKLERMTRVPGLAPLLGWLAGRDPEAAARRSILDPALLERTLAHPEAGPLIRGLGASTRTRLKQRMPGTLNDTIRYQSLPPFPFAALTVPVLVLHGTADRVVPFAHAEAVRAAPRSRVVPLDGGDHVALFTHLDEVRGETQAFLDHRPSL
jgi:pimeloyl-ACP methyl ester carboxylesterase